ncbi:HAD-IA family hydrolase [Actinotalea sp. K2]|uniref:HAD-IA family hydrolase n=1 Tax=Actinotalea sp. K2 TaxID=2939438 RepID=UPI002016E67D|nr:HAD-IA family hydrolase [Actinotalea sp. K2]MCL3861409.1 HAD-IA family hydrolase [Actinotalea sp. K2]
MSTSARDAVRGRAPGLVLDRTFSAVLFDMDGTLISSIGSVVRSWTRLAQEFAIPAERFGDFHGTPARALLDHLMHDRTASERARAVERVEELEVADLDDIAILPGASRALHAVDAPGRSAIVTSCTRRLAQARLVATGLPVPRVVVTVDDVTRGKPDPEPFRLGADRLGVRPEDCLVVEDATAGVQAGEAAGAATLALTTTAADGRIEADLVVRDLSAVRLLLVPDGVRVELC